jgi:hypothetical protein
MLKIDKDKPRCPNCSGVISSNDINVANDVAYCRSCNLSHKFSAVIRNAELMDGIDFNRPPPGIQHHLRGSSSFVSATHRSFPGAVASLGIALFWNGIVSVFVLLAIAATLQHLHVAIPSWFPAPKMNGESMGVGVTIFLWLFLSPFIMIGTGMIAAFFMSLAGRTEVRVDQHEGSVFTGIGPIGRRQHFTASKVADVRLDTKQWHNSNGNRRRKTSIVIETHTGNLINFGSMLSEERKRFMAAVLRKTLVR